MFDFIRSANAQDAAAVSGAVAVGWAQLYGIDPGVAFAALLGALGLLAFDTRMPARQAVPAVLLGLAVGTYGAIPLCQYLNRPETWRYIVAVVLGLCGYFLLGGALRLAKIWRKDPLNAIKEIKP